jgi:hypothetical protein
MSDVQATVDAILEEREFLRGLRETIRARLSYCSEEDRMKVEALSSRALYPQCTFDREHRLMLYALALRPDQVGWSFKLRERLHRITCTPKRWLAKATWR